MENEDFDMVKSNPEQDNLDVTPETELKMTDPEWSAYVLSHLLADEYKDGFPTVDGLRRVARLLLGPIIGTYTSCHKAPNNNDYSATVGHEVTFLWKRHDSLYSERVTFSGIADMSAIGNPSVFSKALSASAESKAESRALRKALGLRNVYVAEEMDNQEVATNNDEKANDTQFMGMDIVSKKNNVNMTALFNEMKLDRVSLSKMDAQKVLARLHELGSKKVEVPLELVGYISTWRS